MRRKILVLATDRKVAQDYATLLGFGPQEAVGAGFDDDPGALGFESEQIYVVIPSFTMLTRCRRLSRRFLSNGKVRLVAILTSRRDLRIASLTEHGFSELRLLDRSSMAAAEDNPRDVDLTVREMELLVLMAEGLGTREILDVMDIVQSTLNAHKKSLFNKTGLSSSRQLTAYAYRRGLMDD